MTAYLAANHFFVHRPTMGMSHRRQRIDRYRPCERGGRLWHTCVRPKWRSKAGAHDLGPASGNRGCRYRTPYLKHDTDEWRDGSGEHNPCKQARSVSRVLQHVRSHLMRLPFGQAGAGDRGAQVRPIDATPFPLRRDWQVLDRQSPGLRPTPCWALMRLGRFCSASHPGSSVPPSSPTLGTLRIR